MASRTFFTDKNAERRWKAFQRKWDSCCICNLCQTRTKIVLGRGVICPDMMMVGEAPGPEEDEEGEPFVGKSGRLLQRLLVEVANELPWLPTTFLTNTICCFPVDTTSEERSFRKPAKDEIEACSIRLQELFKTVRPSIVIFLGNVANSTTFADSLRSQSFPTSHLLHPSFISRRGGINSTEFYSQKKKLVKLLSDIDSSFKEAELIPKR